MPSTLDSDAELLQFQVSKLEEKYEGNDDLLRVDLKAHGLGQLPFSSQTKRLLMRMLAQKMFDSSSNNLSSFSSKDVASSKISFSEEESSSESNSSLYSDDSNRTFYALCIPGEDDQISIESDFLSVLKKMKEYSKKKPRMLSFSNYFDAVAFANNTSANDVCQGSLIKAAFPKEKAELENQESVPFPSLSVPQLNAFRIHLERGNTSLASELISSNPRFLIGTGDVPTILKVGPRYNALHACVFAGQLSSCKLIMKFLCDIDFLEKMYETKERAERYSTRLVDLYLNTPEKMMNKTPLHFASEKGLVEIVSFLVSFNACDRLLQQTRDFTTYTYTDSVKKSALSPIEIACDKYHNSDKGVIKEKIVNLIREATCFVPLVRSDTTGPYARVVEPFSPSSQHRLVQEVEDNLKSSPSDSLKDFSNLKVWAYAGPMSPQEAHKFKKDWWSPRAKKNPVQKCSLLNIKDGERGFEHYGRELAKSYKVHWQEYWPFLDSFTNFNFPEGLRKLQHFFRKQSVLLQFDQIVNQKKFLKYEAFIVNEDFVHEVKDKDDNESFRSADSLSEASLSENESDKDSVDDDKDECFYDCQDKEEDKAERSDDANYSLNPFGRLWNGFLQLGYYLSPKRGNWEESEQNKTQSALKDCDTNSNTLLPHEIESRGMVQNSDRNVSVEKKQQHFVMKDDENEQMQDNCDKENDDASVVDRRKDVNIVTDNCSILQNKKENLSEIADSWNSKDPKHFSTPLSYRKYRSSSPADIISPDQIEIGPGQMSPQSPDFDSPDKIDNKHPASTPVSLLNCSLDRKIDSFCRTLQAFSFKSPPELTRNDTMGNEIKSVENKNKLKLPFMKLLTCQDISQLEKAYNCCVSQQRTPVLVLKQAQGDEGSCFVLADMYLPTVDTESLTVLDEITHKAVLANVWLDFLITFESWTDASRILSLDQPEMVSVQLHRLSPAGMPSKMPNRFFNVRSLVEQFKRKKEQNIKDTDSMESLHLEFLAARCCILPKRDVYICGSIPTKTDADVYKCLNDEAVQLIHEDQSLDSVSQWLEKMASTGQKSIESLPSPSRALRMSRHVQVPPPISPLVTHDTGGRFADSPLTTRIRSKDDSVVRNIFKESAQKQ